MSTRNYTNDYIKILAAIGVVFIHTTIYRTDIYELEGFRWFFNTVLRFAVPFFIISSGYYVRDNMKALISIVKLYVLVELIYSVATPIAIEHFGNHSIYKIEWYLPAMMIILVLTSYKQKWWTLFLIAISIGYSVALGRIWFIPKIVDFSTTSNWISFIAIFILGRILREKNFKINNQVASYLLLAIAFVLSIYNGLIHLDQVNLLPQVIAIIFFIGSLGVKSKTMPKCLNNISLDLFLFHGLFLPTIVLFDINHLAAYLGYVVVVSILAIAAGYTIRLIDTKLLNNLFYS